MQTIKEIATQFFEACESGKGWDACKKFCHENAQFESQAEALASITTVHEYTEYMPLLFITLPDASYTLNSICSDEDKQVAIASAVFTGTHSGPNGPVPETFKSMSANYSFYIEFIDKKVSKVTKVWNDVFSMKELGWL
ncbi:hypothetical protein BA893_19245 [Vibrio natriegens]|jgi:predicted ester cyclase|uniref:ester cyclase n=1 Tax=Vibrio natriegens TaxID=691 RepID=UPI000804575D|nr:ester cyclase [Vibrio natriegens]ANQ23774.1 hypothetical protein BA893_19245 [Vibrio natriegens]MCY9876921.1 ester cyclase [Vibrio natriegens]